MLKIEQSSQAALETVVGIGKELNLHLSDFLNVDQFVNRLMDRVEGRREHVQKFQFLVAYRQQFLMGDDDE